MLFLKMATTETASQDYYDYIARLDAREQEISDRIKDIVDPLQAIQVVVESEGSTLKAIWESDSGYPIDGTLIMIVMLPVVLGIIGHYVASFWEPATTGEELYDDFGNRIVEYPKMPIAYLQQTRKDLSATRENRNSLAWLCHRWLISTNDVVQELQAPYPLEQSTLRTAPEKKGYARKIADNYEKLQERATAWRMQYKKLKKDDLRKRVEARRRAKPLHTLPRQLIFRGAPESELEYLRRRIPRARKLWKKLNKWVEEYNDRPGKEKSHLSDSNDSYWSSSETFSSDSGEHWRSYKGDARGWVRLKRRTVQWKLEKARRLHEAAIAAEEARKKKEAKAAAARAAAAAAAAEKDSKSKSGSGTDSKHKSGITTPTTTSFTKRIEKRNSNQGDLKKVNDTGEKKPTSGKQ